MNQNVTNSRAASRENQIRKEVTMKTGREFEGLPPIKVIGVGGGGSNAVSRMAAEKIPGVELVAVNTDGQALMQVNADVQIRIVDTLIVIPNDRLLAICDPKASLEDAFRTADEVLRQGIQGISEVITLPGIINLDFADVRRIMGEAGPALLAIGRAKGEHRAAEAARAAITSPLLD